MEILIGGVISLITQGVKLLYQKLSPQTKEVASLATLLGVSLLAGGVYYYLVQENYWTTVYNCILYGAAFYALIIKRFD